VDYLGRERASGVYQITQLMPPEGEFQYRIKNVNESRERVAKESELRAPPCRRRCRRADGGKVSRKVEAKILQLSSWRP
jgi:hypothetical protein